MMKSPMHFGCFMLLAANLLAMPGGLAGQSEQEAVLEVIQELFDAMAAGDTARAGAVLLPEGQLVVQRLRADGSATTGITGHRDFLSSLGESEEVWNERFWDPEVLVQGAIAVVWTPYDFHRGTTFSHCGVDVFNLLRMDDEWKIVGGAYTVQQADCPSSPLGPLE